MWILRMFGGGRSSVAHHIEAPSMDMTSLGRVTLIMWSGDSQISPP